jgi:hypothetical protein
MFAEKNQPELVEPRGILFYGDPHGEWESLIDAVLYGKPAAVVLMGDMGLDEPLRFKLHAIWDLVPEGWWLIIAVLGSNRHHKISVISTCFIAHLADDGTS